MNWVAHIGMIGTLLGAGLASTARAAAPPEGSLDRLSAASPANELRVEVGVASPVGEVGVTGARWFSDTLAVEAGLGYGYTGLQTALMAKLAAGRGKNIFSVAAGPSASFSLDRRPGVTPLLWANAEVGYEYRAPNRWAFIVAAGGTLGLAGRYAPFCVFGVAGDCSVTSVAGVRGPTLRTGVGYRF